MIFLVKSSNGETQYQVNFDLNGEGVFVSCNCKAGILRKSCKHKTGLLKGDVGLLFDPSQSDQLEELNNQLKGSCLMKVFEELDSIERQLAEIKKSLDLKKGLLEKMYQGEVR